MYIRQTNCCAVAEISGLASHRSAVGAMKAFCKEQLQQKTYDYRTGRYIYDRYEQDRLYNHYIFTGIVGYKKGKSTPVYGPNFKAYIEANDLGEVVESQVRNNRLNNPTHMIKVWLWNPHIANLKAWHKKMSSKVKPVKKKVVTKEMIVPVVPAVAAQLT